MWNGVEKNETRKNARFAKELVVALPHELTYERNVELLEEFVRNSLIPLGVACDLAIHTPETSKRKYRSDREGKKYEDHRNIHAHILMTDSPDDRTRRVG